MSNNDNNLEIRSLDELQIQVSEPVRRHLASQYLAHCHDDAQAAEKHLNRVLEALKYPPSMTICRVNQILATRQDLISSLCAEESIQNNTQLQVSNHELFSDVIVLRQKEESSDESSSPQSLKNQRIPLQSTDSNPTSSELFPNWPTRREKGWPMTHRVVLCDRYCGEAVLRGADIFVRGILAADSGISKQEMVAVYADIRDPNQTPVTRGLVLDKYTGTCVFLGLGTAMCSRSDFFRQSSGVGVVMSTQSNHRAGPNLPSLNGILEDKMMLQNLPSIVVGHALDPKPNEFILDMCAAPGGKTLHLASLVKNQATIIACDKSRKKVISMRSSFERQGASCITPLALDSANCVLREDPKTKTCDSRSISEILDSARPSEKDGLMEIKKLPAESFDRILLDPPCSALGLRPKLWIPDDTVKGLEHHARYQTKFISQAVELLKVGGILTFSTCTFQMLENEGNVRHILDNYPCLKLLPIEIGIVLPGLKGSGLDEQERGCVRRFDPSDENTDSMGFFVAKFEKISSYSKP